MKDLFGNTEIAGQPKLSYLQRALVTLYKAHAVSAGLHVDTLPYTPQMERIHNGYCQARVKFGPPSTWLTMPSIGDTFQKLLALRKRGVLKP